MPEPRTVARLLQVLGASVQRGGAHGGRRQCERDPLRTMGGKGCENGANDLWTSVAWVQPSCWTNKQWDNILCQRWAGQGGMLIAAGGARACVFLHVLLAYPEQAVRAYVPIEAGTSWRVPMVKVWVLTTICAISFICTPLWVTRVALNSTHPAQFSSDSIAFRSWRTACSSSALSMLSMTQTPLSRSCWK